MLPPAPAPANGAQEPERKKPASERAKAFFVRQNAKGAWRMKLAVFLGVFALTALIVFLVRDYIGAPGYSPPPPNGFINIVKTYNTGVAFSVGADSTGAVYAVQSAVFALVLFGIVCVRKPDLVVTLALVASGSLCNITDRATSHLVDPLVVNAVLDYFQFWAGGAVFNYADSCIVMGFIAFVIAYLARALAQWSDESRAEREKRRCPPTPA